MAADYSGPATDHTLRSLVGETRDGQPLSINRAAADDLKPWIARVYATNVQVEPDHVVSCGLLSDMPVLRMLFRGDWSAKTLDGWHHYSHCALYFGPQSRYMPVTVKGNFATLAVALTPGAMSAFGPFALAATVDRIVPYTAFGYDPAKLYARFKGKEDPADWLEEVEQIMREYLTHKRGRQPDSLTRAFDMAALVDPNMRVSDFARRHGVSARKVERLVNRDFGMSPKKVLRRARALDIAAQLRGVADAAESEEQVLRYFDQSHLNREFMHFFGISPVQFVRTPQPLLTLTLEIRQARRLELLGRLAEGQKRPWE